MKFPDWDSYIQAPVEYGDDLRVRSNMSAALDEQRENIKNFMEKYQPHRVGCLGSGFLTDIPIREFLHEETEVYLVDWIPSISVEGFKKGLVRRDADSGKIICFICESLDN